MTRTTMSTKDDFSTSKFRQKSRAAETLLTTSAKFLPELVGLSPPLCANGCEFATDSRFLRCCDLLGERVLQLSSPRGRAISDGVGTIQAKSTSMGLELVFENERCSKQEQNSKETTLASIWVRRSSCKKRTEAANDSWSAAYSVQWTRRSKLRKPISRLSTNLASHRIE